MEYYQRRGRLHQLLDSLADEITGHPHEKIVATMQFHDQGDFQAACIAIRDRHEGQMWESSTATEA